MKHQIEFCVLRLLANFEVKKGTKLGFDNKLGHFEKTWLSTLYDRFRVLYFDFK
jgi:hypothetical protein